MKKRFYIIALDRYGCGLISLVTSVYNHIIYANINKYTPVVDFKNYNNLYFKDGKKFKDNSWEYFFEQPMKYSLRDIKNSTNFIVSKNIHLINKDYNIINSIEIPENQDVELTSKQVELKKKFF